MLRRLSSVMVFTLIGRLQAIKVIEIYSYYLQMFQPSPTPSIKSSPTL